MKRKHRKRDRARTTIFTFDVVFPDGHSFPDRVTLDMSAVEFFALPGQLAARFRPPFDDVVLVSGVKPILSPEQVARLKRALEYFLPATGPVE